MRKSNASEPMAEVVGVVADTRTGMKGDPPPLMVYRPYWARLQSLGRLSRSAPLRNLGPPLMPCVMPSGR